MGRHLLKSLPFLLIVACSTPKIANYESHSEPINESLGDGDLDALISPYRDSVNKVMDKVIGFSDSSLVKYEPESPLGNYVADVVLETGFLYLYGLDNLKPDTDNIFCLLNFGGLRAPINAGDITVGNIYELMPFDNTIVIVELSPEKIEALLNYVLGAKGQPISNAEMDLGLANKSLKIGGEPYHFDRNLCVVTSDYLADGGDKMEFFADPVNRYDSGILIRDALIQNIYDHRGIEHYPEMGRIHITE